MASMKKFGEWVRIGERQRDYSRETRTDSNGSSTVCRIISEPGKDFAVEWQVPTGKAHYCINLFIDGKFVDDCLCVSDTGRRYGFFEGPFIFLEPKFEAGGDFQDLCRPDLYNGPQPVSDCPLARNFGTIHVEMFEVRVLDAGDPVSDSETEADAVDNTWEECKELGNGTLLEEKSFVLTHIVGFQRKERSETPEKIVYKPFKEPKPVTSFTIQYHSRGFLEAEGVIPRTKATRCSKRLRRRTNDDDFDAELEEPAQKMNETRPLASDRHNEQDDVKAEPGSVDFDGDDGARVQVNTILGGGPSGNAEMSNSAMTTKEIKRRRLAIDEEIRRLQREKDSLGETRGRVKYEDSEDRKPPASEAHGRRDVLSERLDAEVIDLTLD